MDIEILGRALTTLPANDDHPYRTGPWRPQQVERKADNLDVVAGEIPADLDGVYLRNTENPVHPSLKNYHPFDGDGMVHAIRFAAGRASSISATIPGVCSSGTPIKRARFSGCEPRCKHC